MKKIKEHRKTTAAVVGGTAAAGGLAGGAYLMDRKGRQLKEEGVDRDSASYLERQSMNFADARENIGNRFSRNKEANEFGKAVDTTPERTDESLAEVTDHLSTVAKDAAAEHVE